MTVIIIANDCHYQVIEKKGFFSFRPSL